LRAGGAWVSFVCVDVGISFLVSLFFRSPGAIRQRSSELPGSRFVKEERREGRGQRSPSCKWQTETSWYGCPDGA
jgi:hypothetical protein